MPLTLYSPSVPFLTFGVVHTAKALEKKAANKMDTREFSGMSAGDKSSSIMEGHTDSTTITVGGVTATATVDSEHHFKANMKVKAIEKENAFKQKYGHDKNWKKKKGGKKQPEAEEDSMMRIITLLAMKKAKREERKEARKKHTKSLNMIFLKPVTKNCGATSLIKSYVKKRNALLEPIRLI